MTAREYQMLDHFVLPDFCWTENYFKSLANRTTMLREKYANNPQVEAILNEETWEFKIFNQYAAGTVTCSM